MTSELISTTDSLVELLDRLKSFTDKSECLFVDLEGNNLSRHGTISLVTILPGEGEKVYLVDVTELESSAFTTANADGLTLKDVLESENMTKVFFDIRNDSDALFSLYNVKVASIEDLQLMELATRNFSRRCVNGLAKCIENDAEIGYAKKSEWRKVKEQGKRLFDPNLGGSYAVFDQRPLSTEVLKYCCQDVTLMPHLRNLYRMKLCDAWWLKIQEETAARICLSQGARYNGKGRHMAEAPAGWMYWEPTLKQRQSRKLLDVPEPEISRTAADASEGAPDASQDAIAKIFEAMKLAEHALPSKAPSESSEEGSTHGFRDEYADDSDHSSGFKDLTACDKIGFVSH